MHAKIDWLSFTVLMPDSSVNQGIDNHWAEIVKAMTALTPNIFELLGYVEPSRGGGRKPYSDSVTWADNGIALFYNPKLPHALIEISGKGCDYVESLGHGYALLAAIHPRLTRLDIAADMLCDTTPTEFTSKRSKGRFSSHSEMVSESGETCYIGSRSSNRYGRVYRYNPPHPRSHLLRSEFVLKAEDARITLDAVLSQGLMPVVKALGEQFGWLHPSWQVDEAAPAELQVWRPERREGKTLFWLNDTIAPLLVRLHEEGTIDAYQWFDENIAPHLNTPDNTPITKHRK